MSPTSTLPTLRLDLPSSLTRGEEMLIVEDVPLTGKPFLHLVNFFEPSEKVVSGKTMFARSKEIGNRLGWQHAHLLATQATLIPSAWEPYVLLFPGTRLQSTGGTIFYPFLMFSDGWILRSHSIEKECGSNCRIVRRKN